MRVNVFWDPYIMEAPICQYDGNIDCWAGSRWSAVGYRGGLLRIL